MYKFVKNIVVGGVAMVVAGRFAQFLDKTIDKATDAAKRKQRPKRPKADK